MKTMRDDWWFQKKRVKYNRIAEVVLKAWLFDLGVKMELHISNSAKIALRTLDRRERDRVEALFVALANWTNDPHIQKMSTPLNYKDGKDGKDVYVLKATDGMRIFFNKGADKMVILDIARKETVDQFANAE